MLRAKLFIDILIAGLLLLIMQISLKSQTSISSFIKPEKGIINMGPCAIGDTLVARMEVKSDYDGKLYLTELTPSFEIGKSALDHYPQPQHIEFEGLFHDFPYTFQKGSIDTFEISYKPRPENELPVYPYGWKYAILKMGLTKTISDPDDIYLGVQYLLTAKKTRLYADGYENYYDFDSVYINPTMPLKHQWRVKNVKEFDVNIQAQFQKLISDKKTTDEFFIQDRFAATSEIEIRPSNIVTWDISYSPKDLEADSLRLELYYNREPGVQDTIWVQAKGQGVQQKIDFINTNYQVSNDTITLDDVPISQKILVKGKLYNDGNLPFGKKDLALNKETPQSPDFSWDDIIQPLESGKHLQVGDIASFAFNLSFEQPGEFILSYTIESDISDRGIYGTPESVEFRKLYIKGRCVAPKLNIITDTINMGNVVLNRIDCPSAQDTLYTLFNSGNYELQVDFALDPEYPNTRFNIDTRSITVAPNESKVINIHFESEEYAEYYTDLLIMSNENFPRDTIRVPMRAVSIPPVQATLTLPDIKAKPGRVITVPIVLGKMTLEGNPKSPASLAGTYRDTLFYNPSILRYRGYLLLGTASEFVPNPIIMEFSPGNLHIDISQVGEDTFAEKDTIIKLNFETYLGDAVETPIRFSNPKFGNSNCSNILDIPETNIHNATFKLDSICGIEYIVSPSSSSLFAIRKLSPLPADRDLNMEFNVAAKTYIEFRIYNTFGETLVRESSTLMPKGIYERKLDISNLPVGTYYLEYRAGIYTEIKSFLISR